jgi:shikimate kinase
MVVTLIGYRATGKTTVAPPLARRLQFESIDADTELERRVGRSVRAIFEAEGETGFRTRERALLAELLLRDRLVLAAGGGAVLDPETRNRMRAAGPVVWLRARVETIERQIAADPMTRERRPNLTVAGGRSEIEALLAIRNPLYRDTATLTIDVDHRTIEEVVDAILPGLGVDPTDGTPRSACP